jgi:alpha-N-arabinofuranosidase
VLRVDVHKSARGEAGFLNDGFWGMEVKHQPYEASFYVKGDYSGHFSLSFRSNETNKAYASSSVRVRQSFKDGWQQHSTTILSSKDVLHANNSFSITFDAAKAAGKSLYFDLVSVFPPTFNNRQNGLRPDLVNALIDLNPGYLRWGGSNLEGLYPPFQWKWNETIGPLKDRTGRPGAWSQTNTDGLGVMEYFLVS